MADTRFIEQSGTAMKRQARLSLNILPLRPRWTRLIDLIKPAQPEQWCDELAWFC